MIKKIVSNSSFRRFDIEAFIIVLAVVLIGFVFFCIGMLSVAHEIMKHRPNG
jgi:hypothetical protein